MNQTITCIGCPMGCPLELTIIDGELQEVTGHDCKRGVDYAHQEFRDPRRMVSTTVACRHGLWARLPVRTAAPIPKGKVLEVARALHGIQVDAPVEMGQIIMENAGGTGIAVIATRSMPTQS